MSDETSDGFSSAAPANTRLPTLQRNALCKIFNRAEFTPEEVVALGYRRLRLADGIGQKGMTEIIAWLQANGLELPEPVAQVATQKLPPKKARQRIEHAVRLLRTHGYLVQPANEGSVLPQLAD